MISVKEIKPNEFWLHCIDIEIINEKSGKEIFENTKAIMGEKLNITIDLKDITSISGKGYSFLYETVKEADINMSKIYFSNIHNDLDELINTLSLTD